MKTGNINYQNIYEMLAHLGAAETNIGVLKKMIKMPGSTVEKIDELIDRVDKSREGFERLWAESTKDRDEA
jgi:hypothetical protein